MKKTKYAQLRQHIAQEAARLMYEGQVSEYYNAKKMASKRLLGAGAKLKRVSFIIKFPLA